MATDGESDGDDGWLSNAAWPTAPADHGGDDDEPMDEDNSAANLVDTEALYCLCLTPYRPAMCASSLVAPSVE